MEKKAEYKNAIRSKQLIRQAFFDLLQKKPADKITVTDIVNTANINRGTFYAHYSDIHGLVNAMEQEFVDRLYEAIGQLTHVEALDSPLTVLLKVSEFVEADVALYRSLVRCSVSMSFFSQLQDKLVGFMEDALGKSCVSQSVEFKARARFFAAGAVSLYIAWLKGEIGGTLEELAYTLNDIIVSDSLFFQ